MIKAKIIRNDSGAAAVEMAFVLPILVLMIWIFAQLATMYRALSGIQMALGQGARFATIFAGFREIVSDFVPAERAALFRDNAVRIYAMESD